LPPKPAGFFVLRSPLLPVERARAVGEGLRARAAYASGADAAGLEAAVAHDVALVDERLGAAASDPVVREALFLASPAFEESLDQLRPGAGEERRGKVARSVGKYLARMSARCSPFGLFAGVTTGRCGAATDLSLPPISGYRRFARLDTEYLWELTERTGRDPGFLRTLTFRPSTGLSGAGGVLRYVEAHSDEAEGRSYHLVEVGDSPHLRAALARAASGATVEALAAAVAAADPDVGTKEAEAFVLELIDSQILTSDFTPWLTGPPPAARIARELSARPSHAWMGEALDRADRELSALDGVPLGLPPARYRELAGALDGLPAPARMDHLFQVDLRKPAPGASLGRAVMAELDRALALVQRITPSEEMPGLVELRRAFTARYGDRQVPLLEALDEESGVGFERIADPSSTGGPLLKDFHFTLLHDARPPWDARADVLLSLLDRALRSGAVELSLTEEDLRALEVEDRLPLPGSFFVRGALAAESGAAADRGDFDLHFQYLYGPPGGALLGRFCHADPELEAMVRAHAEAEAAQEPDAIFAELVHLPEGRLGNVICRPVLRPAEIPYLGVGGAPADGQIPLGDLLVAVEGERIVLRSRSRGRRVVPRLTSAHNFRGHDCLAAYRFLGTVQQDGTDEARWTWGPLVNAPFLPRIRVGRIVLSLARWTVRPERWAPLVAARGAEQFREAQRLRDALSLPRRVALAKSDEVLDTLEVDLDDPRSVETLCRAVSHGGRATVHEVFPPDDRLCARGPEGRFRHELVVPYVSGQARPAPRPRPPPADRGFLPGSEWLYARVYSGEAAADGVLLEHLVPLARQAVKRGEADRWFFVRYVDPAPHLRLRLHGPPRELAAKALPALHAALEPLRARGTVWKLELGTYEPEVERYGGPEAVEICERVFHRDSEAAVALLEAAEGDADARWWFALLGLRALLDDFGLSPPERLDLLRAARAFRAKVVPAPLKIDAQLAARYRREREALGALLGAGEAEAPDLEDAVSILRARSAALRPEVAALRALEQGGALRRPRAEIAADVLHMHANRMFHAAAPYQELVLYDFLVRDAVSKLKREGS